MTSTSATIRLAALITVATGVAVGSTPARAGDGLFGLFRRGEHAAPRTTYAVAYAQPGYTYATYAQPSAAYAASEYRQAAYEVAAMPAEAEAAPAAEAAPEPEPAYDAYAAGDATGFVAQLNQLRASAGLGPVAVDANLSAWASQNNAVQSRRGIGHHVTPNCLQNCGWNYASAGEILRGWLASPGHAANMLSPSISRVGVAYGPGPYWTMNAL